jgi:hypothetical protein
MEDLQIRPLAAGEEAGRSLYDRVGKLTPFIRYDRSA